MNIYLIGMGPGELNLLSREALEKIRKSDLIIGSKRLVESVKDYNIETDIIIKADDIIKRIEEFSGDVSVLLSGDTGFYSGAKKLAEYFKEAEVIPGISSLSYFSSKIRIPWQDMKIVSAHGMDLNVLAYLKSYNKLFFLTGGRIRVKDIIDTLNKYSMQESKVFIGENLSLDNEKIYKGIASDYYGKSFDSLSVIVVEHEIKPLKLPKDKDFIRDKVPMTKEEIRNIIVSKMDGKRERVIYDIGSGTGSCSVALAIKYPFSNIYAVERKKEAYELSLKNKEKFNLGNLFVFNGEASEVIDNLKSPDSVFIGGSGGKMSVILEKIKSKNKFAQIIITAITLETLEEARHNLDKLGYKYEISQIQVTNIKKVGNYSMMDAQNPIFILEAKIG